MQLDYNVSLGNIITIAVFIVGWWRAHTSLVRMLDKRVSAFESTILTHAAALAGHANRMEKQDELMLRLVGDVQRLIGRFEGTNRGAGR